MIRAAFVALAAALALQGCAPPVATITPSPAPILATAEPTPTETPVAVETSPLPTATPFAPCIAPQGFVGDIFGLAQVSQGDYS